MFVGHCVANKVLQLPSDDGRRRYHLPRPPIGFQPLHPQPTESATRPMPSRIYWRTGCCDAFARIRPAAPRSLLSEGISEVRNYAEDRLTRSGSRCDSANIRLLQPVHVGQELLEIAGRSLRGEAAPFPSSSNMRCSASDQPLHHAPFWRIHSFVRLSGGRVRALSRKSVRFGPEDRQIEFQPYASQRLEPNRRIHHNCCRGFSFSW